jgi:Arc/MetJ family transcription regulator
MHEAIHTHGRFMRTNIDIDDELMAEAMRASEHRTKKAVVEEGLRLLVRNRELRQAIADTAGIGWQGDLDEMRRDWDFDDDDRRR